MNYLINISTTSFEYVVEELADLYVPVILKDHKGRLHHWLSFSVSFFALGLFLAVIGVCCYDWFPYIITQRKFVIIFNFLLLFSGIPVNKSLYTVSYMLLSSAASGLTFMALYVLVSFKCCDNRKLFGRYVV